MYRTLLFVLLATTMAFSQQGFHGRHKQFAPKDRQERIVKKLDLKEDQIAKFKQLHSDLQKDQIDARAQIQKFRIGLRDQIESENPSKESINTTVTAISKLQTDMKLRMISFWFDVNKMLTPDQQKIWKREPRNFLREGGNGMMRGMRGRFGMRDMPGSPDQAGDDDSPEQSE